MVKRIQQLVAVVALAGVASAGTPINETRPAAADVRVDVANVRGTVVVTGWNERAVEVTGTLGAGSERLEFEGSEQRLTIKVVLPAKSNRAKNTDLSIRVPHGASLDIDCVSSEITVKGVNGDLDLRAASGTIDVKDAAGRVRAETVNGEIAVTGGASSVETKAVSGTIVIRVPEAAPAEAVPAAEAMPETAIPLAIKATTVSGEIAIEAGAVGRLECKAVSGTISFAGSVADGGGFDLETHSGEIELRIPVDTHATYELSTFRGDIKSGIGGNVAKPQFGPGRSLEFVSGNGSARIRARAFSGNIAIKKR